MKIHLTGIGGVGMAGLAVLLKRRGHDVTGCDLKPTARTRWLESLGISVAIGHDAKHVEGQDLVVVTPAVAKDNPEYVAACSCGGSPHTGAGNARCLRRGEVLARLVSETPDSIAVCGSHGKTTTATFIAKLLIALGENVEWAIGGETGDFPVAGCVQSHNSPVLVVEADESDGTLAEYAAKTLVVTNCEYDHPDHFKTRADYIACYDAARAKAREVVEGNEIIEGRARDERRETRAEGRVLASLAPHNRANARMAVEVARRRGHAPEAIAAALPKVVAELPDRRFQRVWPSPLVYTDYAHHPTEMACAIRMARAAAKGRVIVLFQPHRYSRTKALKSEFPAAFAGADEVVLCPTYAAFEQPVEGGDVADLYAACRAWNSSANCPCVGESPRFYLARTCAEAWEHARNTMKSGDLTLLLGAGDIIDLVPQIKKDLSFVQLSTTNLQPRKIWIGAGSNTWKSDLNLDVEYVKTTGSAGRPGATLLADASVGPRIPWMAGIPGTIGGWVKMNAGAFGHSISEVIEAVKVDGKWLPAAACGFSYRHSDIDGEIQDVRFVGEAMSPSLDREIKPSALDLQPRPEDYLARRKKFPPGTKGSVFKNPPGDFAGRLLEACGVKGLRVGGAYVWEEHANVIVAGPDATPSDFLALARLMAARVRSRFGVTLEPEVSGLAFSPAEPM